MKALQLPNIGNHGRLGNQLFTIAATIGLAMRHGYEPRFPAWKYLDQFPNLPREWFGHKMQDCKRLAETFYEYNGALNYDLSVSNWNVSIYGYFQSYKYWHENADKIRHYLTPANCQLGSREAVAVHYRRGDYVGNPNYANLPLNYYLYAYSEHFEGLPIIARSDDAAFVKMYHNQVCGSELEDFKTLAECKYHIISNSTFAWWAAYLGGAKVVAPRQWFAGSLAMRCSTVDFIPNEWINI